MRSSCCFSPRFSVLAWSGKRSLPRLFRMPGGRVRLWSRAYACATARSFCRSCESCTAFIFSVSMRDQTTWQCSRPCLTWNTTARGWLKSPRPVFGAADEIVIVLAVVGTLPVVGIDGQRVEIFLALRRPGFRIPFGKRAVEVLRDGAAHLGDFNAVVVVSVEQVGGELLSAGALIAFGDHSWPLPVHILQS